MRDAPHTPDQPQRLDPVQRPGPSDCPLDERFDRITRLACRLTGAPIAAISLLAADKHWIKSAPHIQPHEAQRAVAFCAQAVLSSDLSPVGDARADARFADSPLVAGDVGVRFFAGHPLRSADGAALGALCVADLSPRKISREDEACLRDLAAIAEGELNSLMHEAVREDLLAQIGSEHRRSIVDPLTKIWNREGLFEAIDADLAPRLRTSRPGAVIMADLDRFKAINDTHGHGVGDEVLCEAAKRIRQAVRDCDAVGRYGGEEFLIVLGDVADADEATDIAERIRARIADTPVFTNAGSVLLTITLGVAYAPAGSRCTPESLIGMADAGLYAGKQAGRNRVECMRWLPMTKAAA
jgi:diguanylate cyclase (GGDEF)-like protein